MIKNNKGFAITEVLVVSTVIIGVLVFIYAEFKNINRSYQNVFKSDTPEGLYLANNIMSYINEDTYDVLVNKLETENLKYIDITSCDPLIFSTSSYCELLVEKSNIKKIIFTKEDTSDLKENMDSLDEGLKNYIKTIKPLGSKNDYRIIVEYNDETYATLRFNKGDAYVQNGLIAHLDAINNTGNGHSDNTNIWKDLSGNNNDATLYNNPVWTSNAITFDGINDYGLINNTANIEFPNGITLEARVNIIGSNTVEFLGNWEGGGGGIYRSGNSSLRTNLYIAGSYRTLISEVNINTNEMHTITMTYDNNNIKIYLDGNIVGTQSLNLNTALSISRAPFGIGGNPRQSIPLMDTYANVEFQNVLIYDRPLTEYEIKRNYELDTLRY